MSIVPNRPLPIVTDADWEEARRLSERRARLVLHDRSQAADVAQEACLRAAQLYEMRYDPCLGSFSRWVEAIARNLALNVNRGGMRALRLMAEAAYTSAREPLGVDQVPMHNPEFIALAIGIAVDAYDHLGESVRATIVREIAGVEREQIAAETGFCASTQGGRIFRFLGDVNAKLVECGIRGFRFESVIDLYILVAEDFRRHPESPIKGLIANGLDVSRIQVDPRAIARDSLAAGAAIEADRDAPAIVSEVLIYCLRRIAQEVVVIEDDAYESLKTYIQRVSLSLPGIIGIPSIGALACHSRVMIDPTDR